MIRVSTTTAALHYMISSYLASVLHSTSNKTYLQYVPSPYKQNATISREKRQGFLVLYIKTNLNLAYKIWGCGVRSCSRCFTGLHHYGGEGVLENVTPLPSNAEAYRVNDIEPCIIVSNWANQSPRPQSHHGSVTVIGQDWSGENNHHHNNKRTGSSKTIQVR